MKICIDKKVGKLIHEYELGLLSPDDAAEFESHLCDCEYCFQEYKRFEKTSHHLSFDKQVKKKIQDLANEDVESPAESTDVRSRVWSNIRNWLSPTRLSVAAAIILTFLIIQPWKIEISPTQEAVASKNPTAVMNFRNLKQPDDYNRTADIATNLLITDLSEMPMLNVLSLQRIDDVSEFIGYDKTDSLNPSVISDFAHHTSAKWIISCNILQEIPNLIITFQIINAENSEIQNSGRVTGEYEESIFEIIDRLSVKIHDAILPDLEPIDISDYAVAELTTESPEAYHYYLDGKQLLSKVYIDEAVVSFKRAVEIDSTFAMAYYYLAFCLTGPEQDTAISNAVKYMDNTRTRDKYFIRSQQAHLNNNSQMAINELLNLLKYYPDDAEAYSQLSIYETARGEMDKAIEYIKKAIEINPFDKHALNHLVYLFNNAGDFEKALATIEEYIKIAPNEANPYDTRGDIYSSNGKFYLAIQAYQDALRIKPDQYTTLEKLTVYSIFTNQFEQARAAINSLNDSHNPKYQTIADNLTASLNIRQGLNYKALDILDEGLKRDIKLQLTRSAVIKRWLKVTIYSELQEFDKALNELEQCKILHTIVNPLDRLGYLHYHAQLLAKFGDIKGARQIAKNIKDNLAGEASGDYGYWYAIGSIELTCGNSNEAAIAFEKASAVYKQYPVNFMLAQSYIEMEQFKKAIDILNEMRLSMSNPRFFWSTMDSKIDYYLAIAYEGTGQADKAVSHYRKFIELMSKADPGIKEIEGARERLVRLQGN